MARKQTSTGAPEKVRRTPRPSQVEGEDAIGSTRPAAPGRTTPVQRQQAQRTADDEQPTTGNARDEGRAEDE